ncbi:MAG: nuclear transport factor 2 family protein [Eggerthellaceae bacterium]|nr:nuclear transport factor 2 family protein [Eggerthellaceae bacterium]
MGDRQQIEEIIRNIASSFSGEQSTSDWTEEAIWFDASPYACVGAAKAAEVFDEAFGALGSCEAEILDMRVRVTGDAALVCSVQKWDTALADGTVNPPFMMRQTNYLEKVGGQWKVLHEHTSAAADWDGTIDE